ncbi:hypothetical protein Btru_016308 [Bulinus truncatus]|nr:hypothetical protein Btru_016308 [Bulinus truncatus]
MPKLAEFSMKLRYYKENHSCNISVPMGITVSELKATCSFASQKEIKDCLVAYKKENDNLFLIQDTEVINNCVAHAKEILLLSLNEMHHKIDSEKKCSSEPYSWFDELPDKLKNQRLTPGVASLLSTCFGQFWESVFYCLGFTTELVELEVENCRNNPCKAATKLLMKWEHKFTKEATFKCLVDKLIRVHKYGCTVINWKSVQEIMSETL